MFDAGVSVDDHGHVTHEERTAFGNDHHLEFAGRLEDLLTLIPARLIVTLDREGADRLHAPEMKEGVLQRVHLGPETAGGPIENGSRGKGSRSGDDTGLGHLAGGEDFRGVVRGIVDGGDAKGKSREVDPVLLRRDLLARLGAMGMGIDESGQDHLAGDIDDGDATRDLDLRPRAHGHDAIAFHENGGLLDDAAIGHGHRLAADEGVTGVRLVVPGHKAEVLGPGLGFEIIEISRVEDGPERPVELLAVAGEMDPFARIIAHLGDGKSRGLGSHLDGLSGTDKGGDVNVETLDESDSLAIGREGIVGGPFAGVMFAFFVAIEIGGNEAQMVAVLVG